MISKKALHGSNTAHLYLYPPLKQPSKERLTFASTNTRTEQLYVRKLIVKRVTHFNNLEIFKTIILDARFIKKAWRNLLRSKSFRHVEVYLSEPTVFDLLIYIFWELPKRTIHSITVHIDPKSSNHKITQLVNLLKPIKHVKTLRLIFDGTEEAPFNKCAPSIASVIEQNLFAFEKIFLDFQGISAFLVNNLLLHVRHWNSNVGISLAPGELRAPLQLNNNFQALKTSHKSLPEKDLRSLKLKFLNLKRFEDNVLNKIIEGHNGLKSMQSLTLVLNRFELGETRAEILSKYIRENSGLESLQFIVYYLKFHKMLYSKLLEAIEEKGERLRRLVMGHLVIKDSLKEELVRVLKKAEGLEYLGLYWDIREAILGDKGKGKEELLWEFLDMKPKLREVEMVIVYQMTILEDNKEDSLEDIQKSLGILFKKLGKLPSLEKLVLVFPEMGVDVGNMVNEMVIESVGIRDLRIDCEQYNVNYMWELKEIQKLKKFKVEINTVSKEVKEDFNGDGFRLNMYHDSYDHFAYVHQRFYEKYVN